MLRRVIIVLATVALLLGFVRPAVDSVSAQAPAGQPAGAGNAGPVQLPPPDPTRRGRVHEENQRPGTTRWESDELRRTAEEHRQRGQHIRDPHEERDDRGGPDQPRGQSAPAFNAPAPSPTRSAADSGAAATQTEVWKDTAIRGYADQASVNRGSAIRFFVGTIRANYDTEIYRMGWYGGTGARLIATAYNLPGQNQPVPTPQSGTGLIAANWQVSYTLQTDPTWVSGVYLAKLITALGEVSYIIFVVRDDGDPSDILYQLPLTTYQAYNKWGGKSLYDYQSTGGRAYKVSFDRPYDNWDGAGLVFDGDYNMIRWLESQGYDISYATSVDTQASPSIFTNRKVFLSPWHDEYWSKPMRDNLTAARDQGKHLAFFDANNIYWQIRFENSASGVPNRVITCYKDATLDPTRNTNPSLTTVNWRDAPVNQPENALLGVMFESLFNYGSSFPWVVQNASHWIYAGTGLTNGSQIAGLVGYEYDKVWNNGLTPAGLQVLSASPVVDSNNVSSTSNSSIYTAPSGAMVFAAGTIYWPWKLDDNTYQTHGADARVQRMTSNILAAMISGVPGGSPTSTPTATASPVVPTATSSPTSTPTATSSPTSTPMATASPVVPTVTSSPTSMPTATSIPTNTPTSTPMATASPVVPTATSIPTSTPTPVAAMPTALPTSTPTVVQASTPSPMPAAPCAPRPPVSVAIAPSAGRLQVTIGATSSADTPANQLASLQLQSGTNTLVDIPGGQSGVTGSLPIPLPAGTQSYTFFVRPRVAGQAVTLPLTVTDACGAWPTFVGVGPEGFQAAAPPLAPPRRRP